MVSLSELMQAAQAKQQAENYDPLAQVAQSTIGGIYAGIQMKKAAQKEALDRAVKLIDIREKMSNMATAETNRRISENFAKGAGLLPHTPGEMDTARGVAFDDLGKPPSALGPRSPMSPDTGPHVNTMKGNMDEAWHVAGGKDGYDLVPSFSAKGGFSFTGKARPKKAGDTLNGIAKAAALQGKIYALALRMASTEQSDLDRKQPGFDPMVYKPLPPTQDAIQKYLPIAQTYLMSGKNYNKLMGDAGDPLNLGLSNDLSIDDGEE